MPSHLITFVDAMFPLENGQEGFSTILPIEISNYGIIFGCMDEL